MPVKADYKRAKKVSVLDGLEEMRAEAAKKAAAEAALPKFKKFDPQYAEASLVPELRATRPPKEGGGDEAPAWMSQALNAKRKRRRRGSKARGPDALPADYAAPPPGGGAAAAGGDDASLASGASAGGPRGPDLAAGLRPVEPGAHLALAERKAVGNKDWGPSVFERDSPRARATLRTFLCDFLVDDARGNVRVRKDIDLRAYAREATRGAAKESDIPHFKGSYLGRFPLVLAHSWTSDHLSERSRSLDAFSGTRARGTPTLKRT